MTIDRSLLPHPSEYYRREFPELLNKKFYQPWVMVHCCFHDDKHPSLSINLQHGGFHCFSCDAKGGDVIAFVMMRYHLRFTHACLFLGVDL